MSNTIYDLAHLETVFLTGTSVQVSKHVMQVVGFECVPDLNGDDDESRVVARLAIPIDVAFDLHEKMGEMLRAVQR
jgi:hypothetical protein